MAEAHGRPLSGSGDRRTVPNDPQSSQTRLALIAGTMLAIVVLTLYVIAVVLTGRPAVIQQVAYNAPIAFVFLVLATELVLIFWREGCRSLMRKRGPALVAWAAGTVVLLLRFGPTRLEVSGHLTWLPVLTADAWARRLPGWFLGCAAAATVVAILLKFHVFGGPSGAPGLIIGSMLAAFLLWYGRAGND